MKVIDRILYKLDDLVRPYVHKILGKLKIFKYKIFNIKIISILKINSKKYSNVYYNFQLLLNLYLLMRITMLELRAEKLFPI